MNEAKVGLESVPSVASTPSTDSIPWQKEAIYPEASQSSSDRNTVDVPADISFALLQKGFDIDRQGVVRWRQDSITSIHPRRWSLLRKSYDSAVICFMEFIMTLISNTGSSIAPYAMEDLGISRELALFYFTTLYLLGQAIGGLILPPVAESFGGRSIYLTSTIAYSACCVILGACPTVPVVIVMRFASGFLSAMPAVVACGSIENMWDTKARIWLVHVWISSAVAGLACAPTIATVISESHLRWPWLFYIAAIVTAAIALMCCWMTESRPSQLLKKEVKDVARNNSFSGLSLDDADSTPDLKTFVRVHLALPIRLFLTEPIVFLTSIMGATVYGIIYLFTPALPVIYTSPPYTFTPLQTSLVSLALALGIPLTFLPRIYDILLLRRKAPSTIEPEDKLFGFYVAAPVLAVGLWIFSTTIPPLTSHLTPWISIAALTLIGFAVVEFDNVLSGYLTDTYTSYAASAISPMSFLRAVLSGVFPLFGERMFRGLGGGYAGMVLAGCATGFCVVAAGFWRWGRGVRGRSRMASDGCGS
ncbi:hypothetical protein M409DRAFT_66065 [Zasmidium cellare ATCC 36951]|uniref:Major facilitator superfamily (MFS) profile domain-containing protein n=1 Tax=Zasmidium cellare ATCC 36951 TaxID=1080233 RepID=A0A6A6CKH4_ZASCE|nr:uncharacterized protein M409DRAFT_66065 [Zasmidium cellare ATCC 36951]KAF2167541.1 hypothetical protein M409DRAFT_66065 [Zasmidium cellare ATCC 36951]